MQRWPSSIRLTTPDLPIVLIFLPSHHVFTYNFSEEDWQSQKVKSHFTWPVWLGGFLKCSPWCHNYQTETRNCPLSAKCCHRGTSGRHLGGVLTLTAKEGRYPSEDVWQIPPGFGLETIFFGKNKNKNTHTWYIYPSLCTMCVQENFYFWYNFCVKILNSLEVYLK